jgi:hypothetical protein
VLIYGPQGEQFFIIKREPHQHLKELLAEYRKNRPRQAVDTSSEEETSGLSSKDSD